MGARSGRLSKLLRATTLTVVAIFTLVPFTTGSVEQQVNVASADLLPASGLRAAYTGTEQGYFAETGFWVAPGDFFDFFKSHGGVAAFGPPISNRFPLLGEDIQLFRHHALKQSRDGVVSTVSLLDLGAVPSLRVDGRTLPAADPQLVSSAPSPEGAFEIDASIGNSSPFARSPQIWPSWPMRRLVCPECAKRATCSRWAARNRSGISTSIGPDTTPALARPNMRSAAGLNSTMRCDASIEMIASIAEATMPVSRESLSPDMGARSFHGSRDQCKGVGTSAAQAGHCSGGPRMAAFMHPGTT